MAIDKRTARRFRKRLQLRYGEDGPVRLGFTEDFSATGLFIRATAICPPNSVLTIDLQTPESQSIRLQARVMWAKKVPQNMMQRIKGGMGVHFIRFESGEELYRQLCASLNR